MLGGLQVAEAKEGLIQAMKDYDAAVRQAAAEALDQLGWQPDSDEERGLYVIAKQQWGEARGLGEASVPHFLRILHDRNSGVCRGAKESLVQIGTPAVGILVEVLSQPTAQVEATLKTKDEIINLLGQIGESAVGPLIEKLQKATYLETAFQFSLALAKVGVPAVPQLLEVLQTGDEHARTGAMKALGTIKDPSTLESIVLALQDKSSHVRAGGAWALGEFGDDSHLEILENCLKDKNRDVREQAQSALSKLKSRSRQRR